MTEKRFTYGLRKGTTMWEIKDSYGEFPFTEPWYYESHAKKVCEFLNDLHDKNQHIKNIIIESYDNERTDMGRAVLRQLMERLDIHV